MSEIFGMFQKGVGVGAWVVGLAFALVIALPVFGLLFAVIGWILRRGKRRDDQ